MKPFFELIICGKGTGLVMSGGPVRRRDDGVCRVVVVRGHTVDREPDV